jgi:hypothetical protein
MTTNIQLLRSSVSQKRPQPSSLLEGQPAININVGEPGLFFKATDGSLFKVGPVAITSSGNAPNAAAAGPSGNVAGETWLDGRSSFANAVLKVYNGTQWVAASGFQVDNSTGNFQLSKLLTVTTLIANGTGSSAYVRLPNAPNATEPTLPTSAGALYFNTTTNSFRGYDGTTWADISGGNIQGNLNVTGNGQINGTLGVDGSVILGNDCTIDTVTINAATNIACNATVGVSSANTLSVNASTTFLSPTRHINQQPARFYAGTVAGSNFVALRAPSSIAANVTWTLPDADGQSGQFLRTNGAGSLAWSGSQGPIQEYDQTITNNYSISIGNNALSVGTATINPGVTVTIPLGSRWVVV